MVLIINFMKYEANHLTVKIALLISEQTTDRFPNMMKLGLHNKDFGETEFAQEFELQFHAASKMILKPSDFAFMDRICVPFVNKNLMSTNPYLQDENIT